MTLQCYERRRARVPRRVEDALQGVRMQTGHLGQPLLGDAGLLEVRPNALDRAFNHKHTRNTSECVFQAHNHTGMGSRRDMRTRMAKTPDERREILRAFMQERGLKAAKWAKESAVSPNSLYNFLNEHSHALDPVTYGKLARTAGVPSWKLSGDEPEIQSPTTVWVAGSVEAGAFREAIEWDRSKWYAIDVPVQPRFQKMTRALEVRGPSMNLEYREGAIVLWVEMLSVRPPRHGDHVIVYAYRDDDEIEATVKELRVTDGKRWLWPRSDHPDHQQPVDVDNPAENIKRIEIHGLVIGDYRQRHI